MKYELRSLAASKIWAFYRNVAKKYRHTYSFDDMQRNIRLAVLNTYKIEQGLPRRRPTISRWQGYYMAKAGKWYYAYTVEGDTIIVHDACHSQNMHEHQQQ